VRESVEVQVGKDEVRIFHAGTLVATHARSREPHARVVDPAHWKGLWRARTQEPTREDSKLAVLGRSLEDYADVVEQSAKRGAV
jgi:hypothetical protein